MLQGGPSHDCQRASRKLSVHAVVCAHHAPHYTVQALRARGKRAVSRLISRFRVAFYCRRVDLVRVYARRPRRTLRSHDRQRVPRKLSVNAVVLCASCTHYTVQALRARGKRAVVLPYAFGSRSIVAGWTWCASTRGGRGIRDDARMIVNAHHVS